MKCVKILPTLILLLMLVLLAFILSVPRAHAQTSAVESHETWGAAPKQERFTVTDTSTLMTTAYDAQATSDGRALGVWTKVRAVILSVESNDIRVSFGPAANQGGSASGHVLVAGTLWRVPSGSMARSMYIINKAGGSAAALNVTLEY